MNRIILLTLLVLLLSGCRITTTVVGQGTVTSASGNFNCTNNVGACTKDYATAGSEVFTAVPAPGWTFAKWTNCNYVSLTSCGTSFGKNTATDNWPITATFKLIDPPVQAASYTYNALGQRLTKKVGAVTTLFQYDLYGNLMAELNSSGQALRQHIHIDNEPIAQLTRKTDGTVDVHYVHTDHLGTPTLLTNQSGYVVADIEAMPFGETFVDYAEVEYNKRFPGQYKDAETGLHYNYFRDYDPSTGRYVQSDPIGLQGGLNTYGYVGGNTLMYSDPYGLARFGFRPLAGDDIYYISHVIPDGRGNHHRAHEQLWFDDNTNENVGFFSGDGSSAGPAVCGEDGDVRADNGHSRFEYDFIGTVYDDDLMRQALDNIRSNWDSNTYCLAGRNCQHFADVLRKEYSRLGSPHGCRPTRRGMRCN